MPLGLLRFTNALGGTADFIYPGPATDMQSPASALAVDGQLYRYYAQSFDMVDWEEGTGNYTASGGTLARTTVVANSLGTTAKINFSNPPQIMVFDSGQSLGADIVSVGNWTPTITFSTPGDLSVTYLAGWKGYYTKVGRLVSVQFALVTNTFTWTTASGALLINGLPFTPVPADGSYRAYSPAVFQGINKAGYSNVILSLAGNNNQIQPLATGMGVPATNIVAADCPSGGQIVLGGSFSYLN